MAIGLSVDGTTTGWGGCNCRTHVQNSHSPFLSRPVLKFPRLKEHSTVSFMYNTMYIRKALRWRQYLTIFVLYTQPSVLNIEFYLLLMKYCKVFLKTNCQKYVYLSIQHNTKFIRFMNFESVGVENSFFYIFERQFFPFFHHRFAKIYSFSWNESDFFWY